uniref:MFS_1_like domain-containing protein n=1 Tax=Macrostomum lignano TaxID=282301 RepID=A0A1I8JQU6_9PLAT
PTQPGMAAQVQIYDTLEDAMGAARGDSHSDVINPCPYRVYKRRWYILAVYCLLAFNQGVIWNTWGRPFKRRNAVGLLLGQFRVWHAAKLAPIGAFSFQFGHLFVKNSTNTTVEDIRQSVAHLLYLECGLAFFSLLLFVAYFPAKPKLPSSASAQVNRLSFRDSLAQLIGRGDNGGTCFALWSACLAYSIVAGVSPVWASLPPWPSLIFATSCAGLRFLYSAVPFFFELAADLAYPAPESVICGFLTLGNNLVAMAFLGVVTGGVGVDKAGRMLWINWTMAAVCFAAAAGTA